MKMLLLGLIAAGMGFAVVGCASTSETMKTPADTQPKPYIDTVTNPANQQQLDRTGAIHGGTMMR